MIELKIDLKEIYEFADDIGVAADQVPFAASKSMNDTLFVARDALVKDTWPRHVNQRNPSFPSAVLHVQRSDKSNLHGEINETGVKSASLREHDVGGTRTPKGREFAVAMPWYRALYQTQHGIRSGHRPHDLLNKKNVRVTSKGIFIVYQGRLRLAFAFVPQVHMHADVPFTEDFKTVCTYAMEKELPEALLYAMRTRFT